MSSAANHRVPQVSILRPGILQIQEFPTLPAESLQPAPDWSGAQSLPTASASACSAAGSRESEQCRQLAPSCARHGRKTSSSSALSADTWDGPCAFPPRPQWSSASWWKQLLQPFHSGEKQPECPRSQLLSCLSSLRSLLNCRPSLRSPCRASRPLPWSCLSTSLCSRPSTSAWCSASTSSWLPSSSNPWTQPTSSPSFSSSAWEPL